MYLTFYGFPVNLPPPMLLSCNQRSVHRCISMLPVDTEVVLHSSLQIHQGLSGCSGIGGEQLFKSSEKFTLAGKLISQVFLQSDLVQDLVIFLCICILFSWALWIMLLSSITTVVVNVLSTQMDK